MNTVLLICLIIICVMFLLAFINDQMRRTDILKDQNNILSKQKDLKEEEAKTLKLILETLKEIAWRIRYL